MDKKILKAGENCLRVSSVEKFAILVDGDEYYRAFFNVAEKAKKSICILGWEFEPQIKLRHINKRFPDNLRNYFHHLAKKNKDLRINIAIWRSSIFLSFTREFFSRFKWRLSTPGNVAYKETSHPDIYGSYHEKMAIIDNTCAFLGGMDITHKRWDTSTHELNNPLRKDEEDRPYHPIHDVQIVCRGDLVKDLNLYLKHRNNKPKANHVEKDSSPWPDSCHYQISNIKAALSRTDTTKNFFEIEQLYLDAINSADKFIYIENQYFSHEEIIKSLCYKLQDPSGPEVIIVMPYSYRGLFEKGVYLSERNKAFYLLRSSDIYGRLGIYYPHTSVHDDLRFIVVHSKLMIVDNMFMTVGSANLNHRSMRVDNELNLSFESNGEERVESFIKLNLSRLVSEHLGLSSKGFIKQFEKIGSLLGAIKSLKRDTGKTLKEIPLKPKSPVEQATYLLRPMIDIKYPLSKRYAVIILSMAILMGLIFISES